MNVLAVQTIHAAKQAPCPPIEGSKWTPAPLFSKFEGMKWEVSGKRQTLRNKPGPPSPMLLGPLFLERCGQTEKKWTLSASLHLPEEAREKFGRMHESFLAWLKAFYTDDHLFMTRWKSDFKGQRRPSIRWWRAKGGNFERTTEAVSGLILCTVDKFSKSDESIYIELGMDIIVI